VLVKPPNLEVKRAHEFLPGELPFKSIENGRRSMRIDPNQSGARHVVAWGRSPALGAAAADASVEEPTLRREVLPP